MRHYYSVADPAPSIRYNFYGSGSVSETGAVTGSGEILHVLGCSGLIRAVSGTNKKIQKKGLVQMFTKLHEQECLIDPAV